jgi:hypothetical protein
MEITYYRKDKKQTATVKLTIDQDALQQTQE